MYRILVDRSFSTSSISFPYVSAPIAASRLGQTGSQGFLALFNDYVDFLNYRVPKKDNKEQQKQVRTNDNNNSSYFN